MTYRKRLSVNLSCLVCLLFCGFMTTLPVLRRAEGGKGSADPDPLKANPAYYALLAISIPFDIATLPVQAPLLIATWSMGNRQNPAKPNRAFPRTVRNRAL